MTGWFLAFLVGVFFAVSVPAGVRAKRNSPFSSAQLFKKRMNMIAPRSRGGRWVVIPEPHSAAHARMLERRARRRRIRMMMLLVATAAGTGGWALFGSGVALSIHVAVDLVALGFGALVYRTERRRAVRLREGRALARHPLATPTTSWAQSAPTLRDNDEPLFFEEPIAL